MQEFSNLLRREANLFYREANLLEGFLELLQRFSNRLQREANRLQLSCKWFNLEIKLLFLQITITDTFIQMDTRNNIYTLSFVSIILFYMLRDVNLLVSTIAITISTAVVVYNFIVSLKDRRREQKGQQMIGEKNRQEHQLIMRQLEVLEAQRADDEEQRAEQKAINPKELELLNLQIDKLKNN